MLIRIDLEPWIRIRDQCESVTLLSVLVVLIPFFGESGLKREIHFLDAFPAEIIKFSGI